MKKTILLNAEIARVIAEMGHTDRLTISDCGLPIPDETRRIDLALKKGVPGFLETLDTVLEELCVQEIILAEEIKEASPKLHCEILKRFSGVKVTYVSHETLKKMANQGRAIIRTGEASSYANIVLVSGVTF